MKHVAKKRFGQNFLTDQGVINSLVEAIAPQTADLMVEIGPGLGALTKPLLQKLKLLHVVEVDRDIIAWMRVSENNAVVQLCFDRVIHRFEAVSESNRSKRIAEVNILIAVCIPDPATAAFYNNRRLVRRITHPLGTG